MKRLMSLTAVLGLLFVVGKAFAATPTGSYDFVLQGIANEPTVDSKALNLTYTSKDTIAFDYWYDCVVPPGHEGLTSKLDFTSTNEPLYDYPFHKPSSSWQTYTFGSYMALQSQDDKLLLTFKWVLPEDQIPPGFNEPLTAKLYIKNVRVVDESGSDQPVPEPGTWAMMLTGLLGAVGFEVKRRKAMRQ